MKKSEFYRRARTDLPGPLTGVRVLEATTTWAGPMCSCIFADLGANVIKAELPGGEVARHVPPFLPGGQRSLSFMHTTVNRNKRSICLDLRRDEGREVFRRLVSKSDVVVENFRPGRMARWGLGYEDLRELKPDIVYVSISGYGQFGASHDQVGYDPMAQAASGYISLNGEPKGAPVKSPTYIADDMAGLHGAIGALAALRHRDQTGEGQHIDVALLDTLLFQSNGYLTLGALGAPPQRMGSQFYISAPTNVYRCRDGYVMAGILLDSHWKTLACLLERPELADHSDYATNRARVAHREEVNALLESWIAPRSVEEVLSVFKAEGLAAAPVRSYAEAARDPHVLERDMLQLTRQEDGHEAPVTGPAAKFSRTPTRVRSGAPALGAHSDEILAEHGFGEEERRRLRDAGVI